MLALLSLAYAAPDPFANTHHFEVSAELGWLGTSDPAYERFGGGMLSSYGLRGGYKLHDNVTVIAGWHHAQHGAEIGGAYDYYDDYTSDVNFRTALYTDQITLGSKADVKVFKWLHPYVTVQLVGMRGLARLDDDADDDENLTQVQRAGLTGGFLGTGGAEFPIGSQGKWAIAPYFELGYGWLAPLQLEELGNVQFSGFASRLGIGVRF